MIRFRSRSGFTIMEVMLAIGVVGIVLTPLFITQISVVQSVATYAHKLQRIYLAENFFTQARHDAENEQKYTVEKKIDDPPMQLKYERAPVEKKSALKDIENIVRERVTMTWQDLNKKRTDVITSYLFNLPPKKKAV